MKNIILATLLASTLGLGLAVQANDTSATDNGQGYSQEKDGKHKGKRGGRRGGMNIERLTEQLSLTTEQQAKIKALHEARRANKGEKGKGKKADRKAAREEFKAILTPEQLAKFKELKKNRKDRGGKRGDKRNNAE